MLLEMLVKPVGTCLSQYSIPYPNSISCTGTCELYLQYLIPVDRPIEKAVHGVANTGGRKRYSSKENFVKILKVSHFSLGFSFNKNNNEIKHFQRVLLDFSGSRLGKL